MGSEHGFLLYLQTTKQMLYEQRLLQWKYML